MAELQSHDREKIQKSVKDLDEAASEIKALQNRLTDQMSHMVTTWKGDSARAFTEAHNMFSGRFDKTQAQLRDIVGRLTTTRNMYEENEQEQKDTATQLGSMVNYPTLLPNFGQSL